MNHVGKTLIVVSAAIYFAVDALFMTAARPIGRWIAAQQLFAGLRNWIVSLPPYPTLALFAVPVIVLEPIKPVAACLVATGHIVLGLAVFVVGEILKLVLVERLFCLCSVKLMSIPAFAWAYGKFQQGKTWLLSTEAWQSVLRLNRMVRSSIRNYVATLHVADLKALMFETPAPQEASRDEASAPHVTVLT